MKSQFEENFMLRDLWSGLLLAFLLIAYYVGCAFSDLRNQLAAMEAQVEKNEAQMKWHDELNAQLIVHLGCVATPVYDDNMRAACQIEMDEDDFGNFNETVRAKLEAK